MLEKKVIRGEGIKVPVHKLNSVLQIGDYIITSGVSPKDFVTNEWAVGMHDQALMCLKNIQTILETAGATLEDLISIGTIGLIKAVNTFCPEKNIKLATYASRCIENEILMYLRKSQNQRSEISIDEPLKVDWDGNEMMLSDILGTEPDIISRPIEQSAEQAMLLSAVDRLSDRERQIMHLRFGLRGGTEHTQKEVADAIGISQSYISRLEKRILSRLRRELHDL